jgi:SAM-dependent methyltransferase
MSDSTFGRPHGVLGRLSDAAAARGTAAIERHIAEVAKVTAAETVLIVESDPGQRTGRETASIDVVLSVNTVQRWEDRVACFAELHRVLRPGGRLLLSAPDKWLPVPRHELASEVEKAGFTDLQTWVWEPPGFFSPLAAQLRALRV